MTKLRALSFLLAVAILLTSCSAPRIFETDFGEKRKEYNEDFSIPERPLTESAAPSDFYLTVEAESGELVGCNAHNFNNASGGMTVTGIDTNEDTITVKISVPADGFYDVSVRYYSSSTDKYDLFFVDGMQQGEIHCGVAAKLGDTVFKNVYLTKGEHTLGVGKAWGWIEYDCFTVMPASDPITDETYNVTCKLSNPNADENTVRLYNFLCDIFGKYTLSGQYSDEGRLSEEYRFITEITGEEFAVLGLDMSGYSYTAKKNGTVCTTMEHASDWYHNMGGIVQYCWHWVSPPSHVKTGSMWWSSFYTEHSDINLDKAMNGEDDRLYEKLVDDIRNISEELTKLRDDGVPILWRPLHEASGKWFWWGNCEPESYIKLWNLMYDIMTNEYNLTNLIWVWNGQSPDWYPGDDTVDIVAWDIYPPKHSYGSCSAVFSALDDIVGESKLITLSENGAIMDPDLYYRDNARWLYWGVWWGDYALPGLYTEKEMLIKAYNSEYTLTLDELPNLKKYRLE